MNKLKPILKYSFLILFLNFCFLFSPKPIDKKHFCGDYFSISKNAGFIINCDAYNFVGRSMAPSRLLVQNEARQSRPIYIVLASITGYSIYYAAQPLKSIYVLSLEESVYLGYICINFFILLAALLLFDHIASKLTNNAIPKSLIFILSIFIVSNLITKAFFWTAHQQMFAFFTPLLTIYISTEYMNNISRKRMMVLSFILGLTLLIYGSFLICFAVTMLCYIYNSFIKNKNYTMEEILFTVLYPLIFLIPTIAWIWILKLQNITYYSHELVQYKQLIWIIETLKISISTFIAATQTNLTYFSQTLYCLYPFLAFLAITFCIRKYITSSFVQRTKETDMLVLNLVCFLLFYMFLGYYEPRLTFTLMPILLCLALTQFTSIFYFKSSQILLFIIACVWHYINVTSYGPFS